MAANFLGRVLLDVQPFLQSTKQARDEWGAFSKQLADSQVEARAAALALGAIGGVVINAFRQSLNTFAEFEQGLRNAEIAIGIGTGAMEELRAAALKMGNETQITASTATIALGEMAKAGFDAADSIDAAWGAVSLAIATQGDLQTSSKLIASTIRQFTLDAGEASRVADIFINAIYNSPATLESLAAAMKYAGPIARQYGATLEETVIGLQLLLDTGLRGEQAGTALRNMFIRLVNPTAKTAAIIEKLELSLESVNPQIVGMYNAVETLANKNLSAADATSIFGVRAINAYLTISRAVRNPSARLDELREKMQMVGTALEAQEQQLDTFRGSWTLLTSALETTAIAVGDIVQKLLRPLVDTMRQLVNAFNDADPIIKTFIIVMTGVVGASIALVGSLILIHSQLDAIKTGFAFAITAIANFTRTIIASTRGVIAWGIAMRTAMAQQSAANAVGFLMNLQLALTRLNPVLARAAMSLMTTRGALVALRVALSRIPILFVIVNAFSALAQNGHALKEALNAVASAASAVWQALGGILDALFHAGSPIGQVVRWLLGMEGSFKNINPVAQLFGQIIKGLTGTIVLLGGAIEVVAGGINFLTDLILKGPKAAVEEWNETIKRVDREMFGRLDRIFNPQPIENMRARSRSLKEVVNDINEMYASFGEHSDQTENLETVINQIEALYNLRDQYEGNSEAISLINAEITKLTDKAEVLEGNLADAAREAERLVESLRGELDDLQISLIPDDETRKIAEAQQRYREWFEEIKRQQETNPFMTTDEVEQLILRRQELLQQEISQIQAEAQEEREREARSHLDRILALHEQAERRIFNLRLALAGDGRVRVRMEYDRQLRDHEKFYADYIAELEAAGEDITQVMERQRAERRLIDLQYIEDVMGFYREFYTELHSAQRRLDESAVNVGLLTEPERLQRDLARQLRDIKQHYGELREQMAGDEYSITRLLQQEALARELAQLEYLKAIEDAQKEYADRRAEMQRSIQGDLVDLSGSDSERALFNFLGNVNSTIKAYEQLAEEARKFGRDVESVYDELHQALLVKEALFQEEMARINREANRSRLEEAIKAASEALSDTSIAQLRMLQTQLSMLKDAFTDDSEALKAIEDFSARVDAAISDTVATQARQLTDQLDGMNRATLASLREQVEAWRWAYGDNGEALAAIDSALADITGRIERLDEEFQESVDSIIGSAAEFSRNVSQELTDLGLSEADRQLMAYLDRAGEAARMMAELRQLLPQATEAQAAAIQSALGVLVTALEDSARLGVRVAEEMAMEAVQAYNDGLAEATRSASQAGVSAITGLVRDSISRVLAANAEGLSQARNELKKLLADLTIAGFDYGSLEPIREYIQDVEGMLQRYSITLADFASQQFNEVRRVASAVMDESEARNLNAAMLEEEIGLRQEALEVTKRLAGEGAAGADDVLQAQRNLVTVQLEYVKALQEERDALRANLDAAVEFAEVIESQLGVEGLETLEAMRDVLIGQVVAMQEAGAAYEEYSGLLAQAEGINERILNTLERANEKAIENLSDLADRQTQQAEALDTLRAANRRYMETQIESLDVGRRQARMYAQLVDSMLDSTEASREQAGALERLVREQVALGDASGAISSQRALVDITNERVDSIQNEIAILEERANAMRKLIEDNEEARKSFKEVIDSILEVGAYGVQEEAAFDPLAAARSRRELINQLYDQNLSLEEQMEILKEIDDLTREIAENGNKVSLAFDERQALQGFRDRLDGQLDEQNRAAEEQIRLAEQTAQELQAQLVDTLSDLSVAIQDLNNMLSSLFQAASTGSPFDSIYERLLGDVNRFPQDMAALLTAMRELDDVSESTAQALIQALDIEKYAKEGRLGVEELIEAISAYGDIDFSRLGGISGRAFQDGFNAEAQALLDNLIAELGVERLNAALMSWQAAEGLPRVGLEIGKPIGEQAVTALMAALRDGYDPQDFADFMRAQNERASASVVEGAEEMGANAGRAAARAMMNAMVVTTSGEGLDVKAFMDAALPSTSILDEGLRVGQDVLDGVRTGLGADNESWRNVEKEFSEALTESLVDPAVDMGREAGIGFVGALISGITSQKDALMNAVRGLLQGVDDFLPHSDAKKGPLSTLTQSGRAFTRTFGQGALSQKGWLESRVGAALGAALPSVAPGAYASPVSASVAPGAAGGPVVVNIDARDESSPGPLAVSARRLVSQVDRELRMRGMRKP